MVFKKFINKQKDALYIGLPEAEAESLPASKVNLQIVYEDYHNLYEEFSSQKFILIGRKGCGKSAFAEFTYLKSQDDPNVFCSFISQDNVSLEKLVQLGAEANIEHSKDHLFKWLIYTNIIKMFFDNEASSSSSGYNLLKEFLKKNSGFININSGEIIELVKKHAFEVNIEQFKRFFKGKYNKDIQIKESKAAFYKLIPHLEEVVVDVLTNRVNIDNENSYILFFDDLDISFNAHSDESRDNLIQLLRTTKHVNNRVFAKNLAQAKVIVLIRDDVERLLCTQAADISKLFSSYATDIIWFESEYLENGYDESSLALKKMINKRISNAFENAALPMNNPSDPWGSIISGDFAPKSSFKYICDHTLNRPRDLILYFKPLETGRYSIPLDKWMVNNLLGQYATELVKEISNELSSFYTDNQIQNIFDALKLINESYDCKYSEAIAYLEDNCKDIDADKVLQDLFERSLIGGRSKGSGYAHFKHKTTKKDAHEYKLDDSDVIVVHSGVSINLKKR